MTAEEKEQAKEIGISIYSFGNIEVCIVFRMYIMPTSNNPNSFNFNTPENGP